jgi:hypothetical protein
MSLHFLREFNESHADTRNKNVGSIIAELTLSGNWKKLYYQVRNKNNIQKI